MTRSLMSHARRIITVSAASAALALVGIASPAAADTPPTYYPSGPQTNVNQADLTGWTLCYSGLYDDDDVALYGPGGILDELCTGDYLLLAGGPLGDPVLTVLAAAPRADVLTDTTGDTTTTHNANGSEWYFNDDISWGFALGGDSVQKETCDTVDINAEFRLCFHVESQLMYGGYRAGATESLNNATDWTRYIYHKAPAPAPALADTGVDATASLAVAGGLVALGVASLVFMAVRRRRTAE